ncbi:MAG: hypothetical protein LBD68_03485 [Zoogloeaceae bacterium]|jgi:tetratricopeptide (TPR) repeat protein|nr:hypothetical protein [Zoogloeaceae bacterium]
MSLIERGKAFAGPLAGALFLAALVAAGQARAADRTETLLDFSEKNQWYACHDQDVLEEYDKIAKDAAYYQYVYRILGEDGGDSDIPLLRQWVAAALFKNGTALVRQGKLAEAVALFDELDRRFADDGGDIAGTALGVPPREWAAAGLNNKGVALARQGRLAEAIAVYDRLHECCGIPFYRKVLPNLDDADRAFYDNSEHWSLTAAAAAMFNKGHLLRQQGKFAEAIAVHDENFAPGEREENAPEGETDGGEAKGMNYYFMAEFLDWLGAHEKGKSLMVWQQVVKALVSKAEMLNEQGNPKAAIAVYDEIAALCFSLYRRSRRSDDALLSDPVLQEEFFKALSRRAEAKYSEDAMSVIELSEMLEWIGGRFENLAARESLAQAFLAWWVRIMAQDGKPGREAVIELYDEARYAPSFRGHPEVREAVSAALLEQAEALRERAEGEECPHCDHDEEKGYYERLYEEFGADRNAAIQARVDRALGALLEIRERQLRDDDDGDDDEDCRGYDELGCIRSIRALIERRGWNRWSRDAGGGLAETRKGSGASAARHDPAEWSGDPREKPVSLSSLSPEEAIKKLKPILVSLFVYAETSIEVHDEIARRFGEDANPEVQRQVGKALLHKGLTLNQREDKASLAEAIAVYDEAARRFANDMDIVGSALANSAEASLILGHNEEAVRRAEALRKLHGVDKYLKAVMTFIIWLADPKTPLQSVLETIHAAGDEPHDWSFREARPVIDSLSGARKKRAECLVEYFEGDYGREVRKDQLQSCMGAVR